MRTSMAFVGAMLSGLVAAGSVSGQVEGQSPDGLWQMRADFGGDGGGDVAWIRPRGGQRLELDAAGIAALLAQAPAEFTPGAETAPLVISLPDPTGQLQQFAVFQSSIMERGLAAEFPEIQTYAGYGLDDPTATIRITITPAGFDAQVLSADRHWYIDRYSQNDDRRYTSYYKSQLTNPYRWSCFSSEDQSPLKRESASGLFAGQENSGQTLRTFRLAVSATAEYTAFFGGTVAQGQAAIVTAINRVTGVYERDVAVRLTLVANNSSLVYTVAGTDPFTNTDGVAMLTQNQNTVDSVIGNANYDIGHVFSTGGGGVASLGVVCSTSSKARGVTGQPSPVGDPFSIDYVAHEMGHQFGGSHTFNGSTGSCSGGNRTASAAFEPGSASTIMGYAGICGVDDLQPNSDAYFHSYSYEQIRTFVGTLSCGTSTATSNTPPTFTSVQPSVSIPRSTPFTVSASATDAQGDTITYCWEQRDLGAAQLLSAGDNGASPLFRSFNPTTSGSRTFPRWSVILNSANVDSTNWEKLPNQGRTMNLRVLARDNRLNGGGALGASTSLTVVGTAGPFAVTSPNTAVSWSGLRTVTWSVNNTNVAPINCSSVDILLSTDGGTTFPTVLAAGVPNNGSANVLIPNVSSSTARIMVRAVGNIFFDVSNVNFTVSPPPPGVAFIGTGANTASDAAPNGNANSVIDPGESAIAVFVPISNGGASGATGVVGTISTSTPTVSIVSASAAYPNIASFASASNSVPYLIAVSPDHVCGAPINFSVSISSNEGSGSYSFSLPTGSSPAPQTLTEFRFTGVVAIPDNTGASAEVTIPASGIVGNISEIQFRINGTSCSAAAGATTVGLNHTWVGDLVGTLIAPDGTSVRIFDRPGGVNNDGNNFCNALFRSDASFSSIQSVTAGQNPYTGTWNPSQTLAAFNGRAANGSWIFRVQDLAGADVGSIRDVSIFVRGTNATVCAAPLPSGCEADYNGDGATNLEDLSDFVTDYYTVPAIPGGLQAAAPTYAASVVGFGVPCPFAADAGSPYAANAYRANGYRVGYSSDGANACPPDAISAFPNLDNLSEYVTFFYASGFCP
jgi:subtilisin-like proprotein convertase family protein